MKRRRNITLAKQMWHCKCEGECVFLSLKDQGDQILAVQNVLILNCQNESKVRVIILCLTYLDDVANGLNMKFGLFLPHIVMYVSFTIC